MTALARPMVEGSALSSDEWCTPKSLALLLGWFDLDPCSNRRSHVESGYTAALDGSGSFDDGLAMDWNPRWSVFLQPPYSNVRPWAAKLAAHDAGWCALVKLDPTTKWWATLMSASPQVAPFRKRIKFEGDKAMTANFPSALVYRAWAPSRELAEHLWIARYV